MFDQGIWKILKHKASSSGEARLFESFKKTALHAKADGTVTSYTSNLRRWIELAGAKSFNVFPASVIDASLFISHLSDAYTNHNQLSNQVIAL